MKKVCDFPSRIGIVLALLSLLFSTFLYSTPQHDEYVLKAIFIKKINDYINWPEDKIKNSNKYFLIGVIGKSKIFNTLKTSYKNTKVFNKDVKIIKISKNFQKKFITDFNILFIATKNKKTIQFYVDLAKKNSILLISDTPKFAKLGIHINFYVEKNKLRFEINRNALLQSKLSASSVLLSLAKIVH